MTTIPLSDEQEEGELPDIYEREDRDDCVFDLEDTDLEVELVLDYDQITTDSEDELENYLKRMEILDRMRD